MHIDYVDCIGVSRERFYKLRRFHLLPFTSLNRYPTV